ncbi:hypothetical protein MA16_Dca007247 [Dendrobium catenatum]|uniref:Uncharacterized protein n=1 Tax=Dendrobium catenatum TaxID=906689 RepID=A0A2I0W6H3_9ASPA|nr:hypothetical protein MA16_Dca007247 [Dendrobium catenatum]
MGGNFSNLGETMKKLLEGQSKTASSEAREAFGNPGSGENSNRIRQSEDQKILRVFFLGFPIPAAQLYPSFSRIQRTQQPKAYFHATRKVLMRIRIEGEEPPLLSLPNVKRQPAGCRSIAEAVHGGSAPACDRISDGDCSLQISELAEIS